MPPRPTLYELRRTVWQSLPKVGRRDQRPSHIDRRKSRWSGGIVRRHPCENGLTESFHAVPSRRNPGPSVFDNAEQMLAAWRALFSLRHWKTLIAYRIPTRIEDELRDAPERLKRFEDQVFLNGLARVRPMRSSRANISMSKNLLSTCRSGCRLPGVGQENNFGQRFRTGGPDFAVDVLGKVSDRKVGTR